MFPNGEEGEDNSDYVAVFLTSRRQEDLEVKYDFSVLKSDGTYWSRIGNTFKKFSPEQNSWGYGKAFSKAKLMEKYVTCKPIFYEFVNDSTSRMFKVNVLILMYFQVERATPRGPTHHCLQSGDLLLGQAHSGEDPQV